MEASKERAETARGIRASLNTPLIVLDTDVVVAAVLGSPGSSNDRTVRAVATGEVRLAISDDGLREASRTMNHPDVTSRIGRHGAAFDAALDLGVMGFLHHPRRLDWPSVSDPKDWWMLDLALDSGADFIVTWDGHILDATLPFDVEALTPPTLLARIEA